MFCVISAKINTGLRTITETFVIPKNWIRNGVAYWPNPEKRVSFHQQCKKWKDYEFNQNWLKYTDFKILRKGKVYADYKKAKKVETEELKMLTDMETQASSDEQADEYSTDEEEPNLKKQKIQDEIALMLKDAPPTATAVNSVSSQSKKDPKNSFSQLVAEYAMPNHEEEVLVEEETFTVPTGNQIVHQQQIVQVPGTSSGLSNQNFNMGLHGYQHGNFYLVSNPHDNQNNPNGIYNVLGTSETRVDADIESTEQVQQYGQNTSTVTEFDKTVIDSHIENHQIDEILDSLLNDENMANNSGQFAYKETDIIQDTPTVEQRLIHLTKLVGVLAFKIVSLEKKMDNMQTLLITPVQENVEFLSSNELPVKTIEDMRALEKKIEIPLFRTELVRALSYKHCSMESSVTKMVTAILSDLISDELLMNFTYTGDSKLDKSYRLKDFENINSLAYSIFLFGSNQQVPKCNVPNIQAVKKALSSAVRHSGERVEREQKKKQKGLEKQKKQQQQKQ